MDKGRVILDQERFSIIIDRICHQLIERYDQFDQTCIVGIQPRGVFLSDRICQRLKEILSIDHIRYGKLDITFYRDDFRTRTQPLEASVTQMNFLVDHLNVILVDDVLYTGRTINAALAALNHYGRPERVELLALVDRRFNRHLPIQSNYVGVTVDAVDQAYVKVEWREKGAGEDKVLLYAHKKDAE
ncbi:MAG: bifunctional pyr operon transcriptional regulator/uracil phosphoribosyltransferase PyrR [Saprospiraceae bacterium]